MGLGDREHSKSYKTTMVATSKGRTLKAWGWKHNSITKNHNLRQDLFNNHREQWRGEVGGGLIGSADDTLLMAAIQTTPSQYSSIDTIPFGSHLPFGSHRPFVIIMIG